MKYITTFLTLLLATNLSAQPLKITSAEQVGLDSEKLIYAEKAIEKQISEGNIPGAVLAIVKDGKMPYIKAFGNKTNIPRQEKMEVNTLFDIASCTKPITAICAMLLIERGELSLRDNLDHYIENFNRNKNFEGKHHSIYIKNLLTHTSGLPPYVSIEELKKTYKILNINSLVDYAKKAELRFQPGEDFKYSCINFILLQYIIEKITGQNLLDFAKENIFDILGMTQTGYLPLGNETYKPWAKKKDIASTKILANKQTIRGEVHDPLAHDLNKGISGNAGIFSSAADMGILCAAILADGNYNGNQILSPIAVRAMTSVPSNLTKFGRALGWDVSSTFSSNMGDLFLQPSFGHTGHTGCSITLDKENNMAIILMTNATHVTKYESKHIIRLRARIANCVASSIIQLP